MENSIVINVMNAERTIIGALDVIDADIEVIMQMSDIRDPEKRKANYVRKFTLPGTKNNNRMFQSFHELGYQLSLVPQYTYAGSNVISGQGWSFNPNRKLIAQVIVSNNIFFEGSLQLNKVINEDGMISYETTIYGTLADFFTNIGNINVDDLDFSEYNHNLTAKNILQSQWVPSGQKEVMYRKPGGYSYVEYIKNRIIKFGQEYENYIGEGYVYPLIYQGGSDLKTTVHIDKWQPALYAKTIWDKIFQKAGFRYTSSFLESEMFRRLILPMSKESLQVPQEVADKCEVVANVGNTGTISEGGGPDPYYKYVQGFTGVFTTQAASSAVKFCKDTEGSTAAIPAPRDPGNCFINETTYVAPKDGKFKLTASLQPVIRFTPDQVVKQFAINVRNSLVQDAQGNTIPSNGIKVIAKLKNASTGSIMAEKPTFIAIPASFHVSAIAYAGNIFLEWEGMLTKGTKVEVWLEMVNLQQVSGVSSLTYNTSGQYVNVQQQLYIKGSIGDSSNFTARLSDLNINSGDSVNMSQAAPQMSAEDFLTSINRMFNLFWVPTGKDREFAIEPKDDIYDGAKDKIYDWTQSIDREKPMSIEPLFNLVGNKYTFTYTEDSDYLNKKYTDQNAGIYGDREITIDNDFLDENPEIKTGFSPTPLYSPPFNPDISLSGVFAQDGIKFKRHVPKARILYWGGMMPYKAAFNDPREIWIDAFGTDNKSTGAWIYRNIGSGGALVYEFPYAGHLDNPYSPSIDLNYGLCAEYYFNYTQLTDSNLYNRYWRSTAEEILSPSQHLLTAAVNLSAPEVADLDLRATIQVDNIYYRINKLTYDPISEIGEVELFKTFDYTTFSPSVLSQGASTMDPQSNPGQGAGTGTTTVINTSKNGSIWEDGGWTWRGTEWNEWNESTNVWINGNQDDRPWRKNAPQPQWSVWSNVGRGAANWDTIPRKSFTPGDQYDNFYPAAGDVTVRGKYNNVAANARYVSINGSNNSVMDSARNISISGSFNTVMEGVTNVSVVGDNMVIRKSNASYVDGTEISKGGVNAASQITVVKSPPTIWESAGVISGGKNSVGTFVGRKSPIINANAPLPIPKNAPAFSQLPPAWENYMINNA